MIVVISDSHFEEEARDYVCDATGQPVVYFTRNVPAKAYLKFIERLAQDTKSSQAKRLDLVLAGDIFDINRTTL